MVILSLSPHKNESSTNARVSCVALLSSQHLEWCLEHIRESKISDEKLGGTIGMAHLRGTREGCLCSDSL